MSFEPWNENYPQLVSSQLELGLVGTYSTSKCLSGTDPKKRERERQTVKVETFIAQKTATAGLIRWIRCPRQLVHQKKTDNANGKKSI